MPTSLREHDRTLGDGSPWSPLRDVALDDLVNGGPPCQTFSTCSCGGLLDARPRGAAYAVLAHQRAAQHREWLWSGGLEAPTFAVEIRQLDANSYDRVLRVSPHLARRPAEVAA